MNKTKTTSVYTSPKTELIYIESESILCSSDRPGYDVTLEDMFEHDYNFIS